MGKILLLIPNSPSWLGPARAEIFSKTLQNAGHEVAVKTVGRSRKIDERWIEDVQVVVNHTMVACQSQIRLVATQYPRKAFIHVNHSAIAQIERSPKQSRRMTSSLFSARDIKNIWYGSVDVYHSQLSQAAAVDRCIHFPGPGYLLDRRPPPPARERLNVVVGGRCDAIKNLYNQMIAVKLSGLAADFVMAMNPTKEVAILAKLLDLPLKVYNRLPHPKWLELLRNADVVMSASVAESFCFVASEAMQLGVPTVVSPAIKFGDPCLCADPNDPQALADALLRAVAYTDETTEAAHKLARQAVERRNRCYVEQVERLIESTYERC